MANNVTLPGTGSVIATRETGGAEYQQIEEKLFINTFQTNGAGALNATLTPSTGSYYRILAIKLHVVAAPATSENFVVQIKDAAQVARR